MAMNDLSVLSFLDEALRLAESGYAVFQCVPQGKIPFALTAPQGCNSATSDLDIITKWWTQYPERNIGLKCANILVFDLDCNENIDGAKDLTDIVQRLGPLPDSALARTGSGGWHLFFAKPDIDIIGQKKIKWQGIKTGIDIQTGNQYIVAPPSIHPNGNRYQWHSPFCPVFQLPSLPKEWLENVLPKRNVIVPIAQTTVEDGMGSNLSFGQIKQTFDIINRCRSYVAAMPAAIQGQSGHSDLLRAANVIFHGFGLSEPDGWQVMLEYNSRCCPPWDLSHPQDEKEFRRKIRQAIENPPRAQPFGYLLNQTAYTGTSGGADISTLVEHSNTQPNNDVHSETKRDLERIPEYLQNVPGFVGKLVDFCTAHSPYPNRILALCGALSLMAFLIIRKVRAEGGVRPNVYIVALADSGTGKEYIRTVNKYILEMTGQCEYEGESIASGEGLEDDIITYKKKLYQTDEIQTLIRAITTGKNNGALDYAAAFLMSVFTSSDSDYIGRAKAGTKKKESRTVRQPGLILFGTTTPAAFFESLTPSFLEDGLGSRTMFIEGNERSDYNPNASDYSEVPQELINIAQWWKDFMPPNPEIGKVRNLYDEQPEPTVIPITPEAEQIISRLGSQADSNYKKTDDGVEQTAWTRVRENAIKLATIYACSENHEHPVIGADAASWATEFVYWMQEKMVYLIRNHVADQYFAKQCLRAEDIIRKHGGIISRTELARAMRLRPRELDELVQALLIEESIEIIFDTAVAKPRILYKLI